MVDWAQNFPSFRVSSHDACSKLIPTYLYGGIWHHACNSALLRVLSKRGFCEPETFILRCSLHRKMQAKTSLSGTPSLDEKGLNCVKGTSLLKTCHVQQPEEVKIKAENNCTLLLCLVDFILNFKKLVVVFLSLSVSPLAIGFPCPVFNVLSHPELISSVQITGC